MTRYALVLPLAIVLFVGGALRADAQTVIVQGAPARSTIELSLNGGTPVSAAADGAGDATVILPGNMADSVVSMSVDLCTTTVRVLLIERGVAAPPSAAGCVRTDVGRVLAASAITTFVVDLDGANVAVHLRQGPAPASWLRGAAERAAKSKIHWSTPARGLGLFAGAGLARLTDTVTAACGNATACDSTTISPVVSLGVDVWITRFLGAAVSYVRPSDVTASGSGDTYKFDTRVTTRLAIVAAKAGVSAKGARIYGLGGLNRMQATSTTNETLTADGSTQTLAQQSEGWNWVAGGGVEGWVSSHVAIYGEFTMVNLKGAPVGGGEGGIDDRMMFAVIGARLHLGR